MQSNTTSYQAKDTPQAVVKDITPTMPLYPIATTVITTTQSIVALSVTMN